ncbi:MAG: DNA-binding domain-containing protein [Mangrovibacterium sp.]
MANVLHKVKAYLYDNPLTENPEDYSARVISERSLGIGEICDSAVSRGGGRYLFGFDAARGKPVSERDGLPALRRLFGQHGLFYSRPAH